MTPLPTPNSCAVHCPGRNVIHLGYSDNLPLVGSLQSNMTSYGQGSFVLVIHQISYFHQSFFLFSFLERTLTFQNILLFSNSTEVTFQAQHRVVLFVTHYTVFFQEFDFILEHKGKRKQFYLFFSLPTCIFYPRNEFQYISVKTQVLIIFSGTDNANVPDDKLNV